jgi:hypothetical protein
MIQETTFSRLFIALLVAPLVTPVCFLVMALLREGSMTYTGIWVFVLYAIPFAYLATILLGIPLILGLNAANKTSGILYALGGAVIGIIMEMIVFRDWGLLVAAPQRGLFFAIPGALSALVFWAIVYWRPRNSS